MPNQYDPSFKPIEYDPAFRPIEENRNILAEGLSRFTSPIFEFPQKYARKAAEFYFGDSVRKGLALKSLLTGSLSEDDLKKAEFIKDFGVGATDFVAGMISPSPLDLMTLGTFGTGVKLATRAPAAANKLLKASKYMALPVFAEGAYRTSTAETPFEFGMGLAEMAGGAAGYKFSPSGIDDIRLRTPSYTKPKISPNLLEQAKARDIIKSYGQTIDEGTSPESIISYARFLEGRSKILPPTGSRFKRGEVVDPNMPQFGISEKGGAKITSNALFNAEEVTTGYSRPLPAIMVREAIQNAIDSTKHLGNAAKITVDTNGNTLKVADNGKGMSREDIQLYYTTLHESGKIDDPSASGGKGIGAASYMLGGDYFKLRTVVDKEGKKFESTMEGTREQFGEHVDIVTREVNPKTHTGTVIETKLKPTQNSEDMNNMLDEIIENSRTKGRIFHGKEGNTVIVDDLSLRSRGDTIIADKNLLGNGVTISIPSGNVLAPRREIKVSILNNGIFQFSSRHDLPEEVPNMPERIIVDIRPTARERTPEYPFPTARESIKSDLKVKINELVKEALVFPQQKAKKAKLKELYDSISSFNVSRSTKRKVGLFDPGNRLTPYELEKFKSSPVVNSILLYLDDNIDEILESTGQILWKNRLEGIGLVFDEGPDYKLNGIHIPNPNTSKSTILMNIFPSIADHNPVDASRNIPRVLMHEAAHIGSGDILTGGLLDPTELNHPWVGKYLQGYFNELITQGNEYEYSHGTNFLKRLGEVYAKYGPSKFFKQSEKLERIITDQSGGYNTEIQKLLQIYKESRGRPATTEDFLIGTGVKSKSGRRGTSSIPRNDQTDGTGIERLVTSLSNNIPLIREQLESYSRQRASRFGKFAQVNVRGEKSAGKAMKTLKGELDKVEPLSAIRDELTHSEIDKMFRTIGSSKLLTEGDKAHTFDALWKMLDGRAVPQKGQYELLAKVFGREPINEIQTLYAGLGFLGDTRLWSGVAQNLPKLAKTANTMKAMRSSMDLSAPLRQGIGLIHKKEWWTDALPTMIKSMGSKDFFDRRMLEINEEMVQIRERLGYSDPNQKKNLNLEITDPSSISNREEAFLNNYLKQLKIQPIIGWSERAYVGFLNELRFSVFKKLLDNAERQGVDIITSAPTIAKFVNTATGRGDLGKLGRNFNDELNILFFSPKLIKSRLDYFNPAYWKSLDSFTRQEMIKSVLATASTGIMISNLYRLAGNADLSTDITSTDFMKSKMGRIRMDPFAGFQQYIVAAARFIQSAGNLAFQNQTPESRRLGIFQRTPRSIGENLLTGKFSPLASLAWDLANAKISNTGERTSRFGENISNTQLIKNVGMSFVPIFIEDMYELYKKDPSFFESISIPPAVFTGVGMQIYDKEPNQGEFRRLRLR